MHRTVVKSFAALASAALHGGLGRAPGAGERNAGMVLGRWRLDERISAHRGTEVFAAMPVAGERSQARYAVKRLLDSAAEATEITALRREVQAAGEVRSPHVVSVLEAHVHAPPYYFVMPRLAGSSLAALSVDGEPLAVAPALGIARQAALGLEALHDAGRLHGDLKPGNVLVAPGGHVTLVDLGFSRRIDDCRDADACYVLGTVDYLAPEAVCSRLTADVRSDLYSLGVMLYEMLAGRLPFEAATTAEMVAAHVSADPPPLRELNSQVPNDVAELVHSLLAKQPLRRPQSANDVVDQ